MAGCSTKKNTPIRRNYHAVTTKYNVYFNGNESFKKGYKKIEEAYKPNYSDILDMYYVSNPSTAGVATSDMKRTQQKCEKAIKEHSIKKKPKKKVEKMKDPKYASFYNQEEFNPKMDDVWMLFAKSKYYANDYLAASATFTYIIKHFSEDKALVAEAMIWKAKCFKEMEWYYEADDMLEKVSDEAFNDKLNNLYSGAYADLLIDQGEYKEALPHLLAAIETEKKKKTRLHFTFIAGQLYQELGMKQEAYDMYEKVVSASTPYEMEFNARIRQTEVYSSGDSKSLIRSLEKMAKKSKNADYLDQIYYAIGNIYLSNKDTATAIENYITSVEKSTRDGQDKAQSLIALGDIYYSQEKYLLAQPRYSEASSIIDDHHRDYERVSRLSLILDELARDYETVALQDSLQYLAKAPKDERMAAIGREIKKIKDEEEAQRKREAEEREAAKRLDLEIDNMAIMNDKALGNHSKSTWYFANRQTVEKGKLEFQRRFGKRKLEDDWNRKNKAIAVFSDNAFAEASDFDSQNPAVQAEGQSAEQGMTQEQIAAESDPKRPEYYLRQIPFTEDQVAASNAQIADALFDMGVVYDEKLNDYPRAIEVFNEFVRRFGKDNRVADAYYYCYRIAEKQGDESLATEYRNKVVKDCPDSKFATILSTPNYKEKLEAMLTEQDSLYERTYKAYLDGDFQTVSRNSEYMERTYPVSALMPKFMLLNTLSIGKSGSRDSFASALNSLLEKYPSSDVATMAKDILALMNQGNNPEAGTPGGLAALREETMRTEAASNGLGERTFTSAPNVPYLFKLIADSAKVDDNQLLYVTAMYNFTKFLVKDFDLSVRKGVLTVSGLENLDEAVWYSKGIFEDAGIKRILDGKEYKSMIVAVENNDLIGPKYSVDDYDKFYNDSIAPKIGRKRGGAKVELVDADKKAVDDIAESQTSVSVKEGDDLNKAQMKEKTQANESDKAASQKVEDERLKAAKEADEKKKADLQRQIEEKVAQGPKKDLKKYKGLYTYDADALHYFVVLAPKGGADVDAVKKAFDTYNGQNHSLLNLSCNLENSKAFPQIFVIGIMPDASVANSYLRQVVKSAEIKDAFKGVEYRNIVISRENYETLKSSGNINVYMELFKRLYLGR